jgi:hypothetical protein
MICLASVALLVALAACGGESALPGLQGLGGHAGTGGAGAAGQGGGPGQGGMTGQGGNTGTGGHASGGTTGTDGGSDAPTGLGNGSPCTANSQCSSQICAAEGVCCNAQCAGGCQTCVGTLGQCTPIAKGTDPNNACTMDDPSTCGHTGSCNGSGACEYYDSTTTCDSNPSCNTAKSGVILSRVCNGSGSCIPGSSQDCHGYACAGGQCGTTCGADSDCAGTSYCSAQVCLAPPVNLIGNGDLEYGSLANWSSFASGSFVLSNTQSSGIAHGGQFSAGVTNRAHPFDGPAYFLPTGAGKYNISAWATQLTPSGKTPLMGFPLVLQLRGMCQSSTNYNAVSPNFQIPADPGMWVSFSGTVDTSSPADCSSSLSATGITHSNLLYINQYDQATTTNLPDLYLDDLQVTVIDGHNLIGNPTFESASSDGWSANGSTTVTVSTLHPHNGSTYGLASTSRATPMAGPKYALPTGNVRYLFKFWVLHTGTVPHDLSLQGIYTCVGGSPTYFVAPIITGPAIQPATWTMLQGMAAFPPPNEAKGCQLTQAAVFVMTDGTACGTGAGQVECPDLYIDDASITLP